MKRIKIQKGFFPSGYGSKFNTTPTVYLINNKYYAKSTRHSEIAYDGDLLKDGYVCLNKHGNDKYCFFQCNLKDHKTI